MSTEDHTLALLRDIRDGQLAMQSSLSQLQGDMASLKQTHGAILSMLGGQHDAMNDLRQRVERLERQAERPRA